MSIRARAIAALLVAVTAFGCSNPVALPVDDPAFVGRIATFDRGLAAAPEGWAADDRSQLPPAVGHALRNLDPVTT